MDMSQENINTTASGQQAYELIEYFGYTLHYYNKNEISVESDSKWQEAITKWNGEKKDLDDYKKYRNSISSLKNRVFSAEEWNVVADNWAKISSIIKIEDKNPIDLYENLTGENKKPDGCLNLFDIFNGKKNNGKKFSKPKAEIYRLLAAYNLNVFCPIVNEDNLNDLIRLLQENGYIKSIVEGEKEISSNKVHWCIKSALLREYFRKVFGNDYKDVIPWGVYLNLKNTEVKDLLENNKNLILTGAPGTGKTYMAREIANKITNKKVDRIGFTQFHPSYDYTDFVEGLRPDKTTTFERVDGVFKTFCKCAYLGLPVNASQAEIKKKEEEIKNKEEEKSEEVSNPYVFIIDERLRGDLGR